MSTDDQVLLSNAALTTFKLNGQFLALAEQLARPAGLTAAWWQVLGAVVAEPLSVAGIAREMGVTRQSVQRIADLLVAKSLVEYRDNPAHRRAKLVALTADGRDVMLRIGPRHRAAAEALADSLGRDELTAAVESLRRVSKALEHLEGAAHP